MQYHFRVYSEKKGYWAKCIELEGCQTQGDTMAELRLMMSEVLDLVLDEPEDSTEIFPLPNPKLKGRNILSVPVTPRIALAMMVRQARLKHKMTQKQTAEKLGMKNVYSYQRLESSKTANPEFTTLLRLKALFPELSVDMAMG